jgi:hypothetical protein
MPNPYTLTPKDGALILTHAAIPEDRLALRISLPRTGTEQVVAERIAVLLNVLDGLPQTARRELEARLAGRAAAAPIGGEGETR